MQKRRAKETDGSQEVADHCLVRATTTEHHDVQPLHRLTGEAFVRAWMQCVQARYLNWLNGVHHKDLSLNSLTYRVQDGAVCGVLNDWDLTVDTPTPQTLPFMAVDLLCEEACRGEVRHLYRHDLEAFLWIFVWVLCCYKDGKEISPLPKTYRLWTLGDTTMCRVSKRDLLMRCFTLDDGPTASWTAEAVLALYILSYLFDAQLARDNIGTYQWPLEPEGSGPVEEADEPEKVWGSSARPLARSTPP
ncbi:hypothetical protein VTO73DRAFT_4225 [Trametes versicolor]